MIDIFTILANANSINGIQISDLTELFVNGNTQIYNIAMIGKGKVILKSKEENLEVKEDFTKINFMILQLMVNMMKLKLLENLIV